LPALASSALYFFNSLSILSDHKKTQRIEVSTSKQHTQHHTKHTD
jgi:hypothetical protein